MELKAFMLPTGNSGQDKLMELMMVDTRENGGCLLLAFPMAPMEQQRQIEAAYGNLFRVKSARQSLVAQRKLEGPEFS